MIQILGLRTYSEDGIEKTKEALFERGWRANSVPELFADLDKHMENIPEDELYNLFYTLSDCEEKRGRLFVSQNILPIDIDDIDVSRYDEYITLTLRTLELPKDKVGIVMSGNGIHILLQVKEWNDEKYFEDKRPLYKAMCGRINQALYSHGLQGQADPSVFCKGRLLRLPRTLNIKNGAKKKCFAINTNIEPLEVTLAQLADMPDLNDGDFIHPKAVKKLPDPDPKGVLEGCDYLKWCYDNQEQVSEPQWYAMLSIVSRLPNGRKLGHDFSIKHSKYSEKHTDLKITQAMEAAGPRTCDNISTLWDGCTECPNFGKCKSPILIKSEEYIRSKDTGFYIVTYTNAGKIQREPDYDGLVKFFDMEHRHVALEDSGIIYIFQDTHWVEFPKQRIHEFAETHMSPKPKHQMCLEFENKLKRTNLQSQEWFNPQGYVNFQNCVLELETGNTLEHSEKFGFRYVLPYDYDPDAICPRFVQFLDEVMIADEELKAVLMEFIGYSISGTDPVIGQKALILYGNGANGKSVLLEVMKMLAGKGNYSTLSMGAEINKETSRYSLSGKLFNVSEETPRDAMVDNTVFKALVSGGEVQARKLYCDSFDMKNYAKIIMACNSLPANYDDSNGMYRRLLIVPFRATFDERTRDPFLVDKLKEELSGIFNLAYQGYKNFMKAKGRFTLSKVIELQVQEYKQESHPLSFFIEEECDMISEAFVPSMALYTQYKIFAEQTGLRAVDIRKFSKLMASYLHTIYGVDMKGRQGANRGFNGIQLNTSQQF